MPEDVEQLLRERRYDRALERLLEDYQHKVFRMVLAMLRDTAPGRGRDAGHLHQAVARAAAL